MYSGLEQREEGVPIHSKTQITLPEIHALPPELLRTIFHYSLQLNIPPMLANYPVLSDLTPLSLAPLNLSQVCRFWRTVALQVSSPGLWAQIDLSFPVLNNLTDLLCRTALVDLCLSRSAFSSYPIDARIIQSYGAGDTELNKVKLVLGGLIFRRGNWRHIHICSWKIRLIFHST